MLFKELKSNYPIFLLDRATLSFEQARVMNVQPNYQSVNMNRIEVNVTIQNKEGKQNTYAVADSEQSAYAGNLFISTSKDSIINEVNALKNASEEVLSKVDEHKQTVEKCKNLLAELDTSFRDQQKTNQRLDQMENKLDEIFKFVKSQKQE
jgi:DNA-binding transcriptional regulator GbsR (MarR family)